MRECTKSCDEDLPHVHARSLKNAKPSAALQEYSLTRAQRLRARPSCPPAADGEVHSQVRGRLLHGARVLPEGDAELVQQIITGSQDGTFVLRDLGVQVLLNSLSEAGRTRREPTDDYMLLRRAAFPRDRQ